MTKTIVKTKAAITAAAIVARYDAVDDLANEERRFYASAVHKIANGTATDDEMRAAGILARKHEFDLEADCKGLEHNTKVIKKYFGEFDADFDKATQDSFLELESQATVQREMIERHNLELNQQKQIVAGLQHRTSQMGDAVLRLQEFKKNRPHLFVES